MKNKKLFFNIYIPFAIIVILSLVIFQILGSQVRIGYLSDFKLLDDDNSYSNYIYNFRIRYYDKVFRNNDIYGVHIDTNSLPKFIKEVKMDYDGSPFGILISDKLIAEEKIDNVSYVLKVKIIIIVPLILLVIFIIYSFKFKSDKYKILIVFLLMVILTVILNKYLFLDAQLWSEDSTVFIQEYIDNGIISLFNSYAGYYHLLPRIITIISFNLSILFTGIITYTPLLMNIFSIVIAISCICYICFDDFYYLGNCNLRILLSLTIFLIPFAPEVFFNATNLHWILSYFIFLVSVNIVYYNRFPNYFISIIILFFSLSSVCGIFISLASLILLFKRYLNLNKNLNNFIKSFTIKELMIFFILNIGTIIQILSIILFSGRVSGSDNNIILNFLYFFYANIIKIFGIRHNDNILYITLILILSSIFIAFIIKSKNKILIYMLICMFIYFLIYCLGQSLSTTKTILNHPDFPGRYLFVPSAIFLTIIFSYAYYLIRNKNRFIYLIGILILLIICNFILHKQSNMLVIRNIEWNTLSRFYYKNGANNLKIKTHPNDGNWYIIIPSNH